MRPWPEGAAPGDLDGVVDGLRQIGEELDHFLRRLEIMLGAQPPPLIDGDIASFRDADQRVMRLVIVGAREIRLVGRDDRQMRVVSQVEQQRLDHPLLLQPVALQLDIEAVAENALERVQGALGKSEIVGGERAVDHAVGAAGERDQAFMVKCQMRNRDHRLAAIGAVAIGFGRELDEIGVAGLVLGEQRDAAVIDVPLDLAWRLGFRFRGGEAQGQRAADDGLNAGLRQGLGEFERAEQIVGIGDGKRRQSVLGSKGDQARNGERALEQRIG